MSHSVHYIFSGSCLEGDPLLDSPLLSEELRAELRRHDFPAESEIALDEDRVRVAFSTDFRFGVLWTDINYSRFLHENDRVRTVERFDAWVRTWCSTVVRADEFFVDKWFAELDVSASIETRSIKDFIHWLRAANPEQTHWVVLGDEKKD